MTGLKGTLQYMAPEQIEMKPSSPASDIFSLGVVCYEALTGRKPFSRKIELETADAIRHHIPPAICDLNPLVSQLVSRVIHKAMAKDPWHRFSTAKEFSESLQKALRGEALERFDRGKIQPRIDRAKKAQAAGDHQFASEILSELEAEGNIDPEMSLLRIQIDQAIRQKSIRQLLESARTRLEEDEFPLALQKIQEVLEIDPDNPDASVCGAPSRSKGANARPRTGFAWSINIFTTGPSVRRGRDWRRSSNSIRMTARRGNFWWMSTGGRRKSNDRARKRSNSTKGQ